MESDSRTAGSGSDSVRTFVAAFRNVLASNSSDWLKVGSFSASDGHWRFTRDSFTPPQSYRGHSLMRPQREASHC